MKFKKIWKQMNRGIVLAGILVIGITIYTLVDNAIFRKEAPIIEKEFREYAEAFIGANVDSKAFIDSGAHWGLKEQEEKEKAFNKVLDQYWTQKKYNTGMNYGGFTKESILFDIKSTLKGMEGMDCYIEQASTNISKIKVKKSGPNGAMLTCEATTSYTAYGPSVLYLPTGYMHYAQEDVYEEQEDMYAEQEIGQTNKKKNQKAEWKLNSSYIFYYLRVNGEWKIAATDWDGQEAQNLTGSNLDNIGGENNGSSN